MRISIVTKVGLGAVILVLITVVAIGGLFFNRGLDILVDQALKDIAEKTDHAGERLKAHIRAQNQDAKTLAKMPPIQGMLRAKRGNSFDIQDSSNSQQWENRLQSIFTAYLENKHDYLKIRFIDKFGQELVVVGREGGKIITLSEDDLQNKAHRDYVQETLKLSEGSVFLSEINLNREYGKVSLPHMEVLRSAVPVVDQIDGEVAGLILITAEIGHRLREIQADVQGNGQNVYITNDQGDYLLHPDPEKTYGFDLEERHYIQKDMPHVATMYAPDNQKKQLILLPKDTNEETVLDFIKVFFDPNHPKRYIAVGIVQRHSEIIALQSGVMSDAVKIALALGILLTIVAFFLAFRLLRPLKIITQNIDDYSHGRESSLVMPINSHDEIGILANTFQGMVENVDEAKHELKWINNNLEKLVAERTSELETSEIMQRSLIDNIIDSIITIDANGIILSFNPAAVRLFGYEVIEVLNQNVNILMPEPHHTAHDQYLDNYHKTGHRKVIGIGSELEGKKKDGSLFPLELTVTEMVVNGEKMFTGVCRDITERKQMEKMKNEFVATVSHELRTPLTSIIGALGIIQSEVLGKLPSEVNSMVDMANHNCDRLMLLINDILDIQKMESGLEVFDLQMLDVADLLQQSLDENEQYAKQHDVKFEVSQTVDDLQIFADSNRMLQVLANLLSNAAKFSADSNLVQIKATVDDDDFIKISVSDQGYGVPEKFQPKLFDKFTQSDSSDTRSVGGTGLGLSISKQIMENQGGYIGYEDNKPRGSTFYVILPRPKQET